MKTIAMTVIIVGLSSFASASSVYSPSKGVICDKKAGFCTDSYGISLGLTKEYLGQKHAKIWEKRLSGKDFDSTSFTMSNGLSCDTNKKTCKKSKWDDNADAHWTGILFGTKISNHKRDGGPDLIQAAKDCKLYLANKFDLPMVAFSVRKGHNNHGTVIVPVNIKWDESRVKERGECKVHNGKVSYHKTSKVKR